MSRHFERTHPQGESRLLQALKPGRDSRVLVPLHTGRRLERRVAWNWRGRLRGAAFFPMGAHHDCIRRGGFRAFGLMSESCSQILNPRDFDFQRCS